MEVTKPFMHFQGSWALEVTKTYRFIGFGTMEVAKVYRFLGCGALEVPNWTKPDRFTKFGAIGGTKACEF